MPDNFATSESHYRLYIKEIQYWVYTFGLYGWEVNFFHEQWDNEARANIRYNIADRSASFNLSLLWDEEPTELEICRSSFHEACELLLGKLSNLAFDGAPFSMRGVIVGYTHEVIGILEKMIWKPYWRKRKSVWETVPSSVKEIGVVNNLKSA